MAETKPVRNTMSRRFSTTRPLGFRGGSTAPGGNLQPPTALEVGGINPPRPESAAPAIANFGVDAPRPPAGAGVGTALAGGVAAEAGKMALKRALGGGVAKSAAATAAPDVATGTGYFNPETGAQTFGYTGNVGTVTGTPLPPVNVADAGLFTGTMTDVPTTGGYFNPETGAETFGYTGDVGPVIGAPLGAAGDVVGAGLDAGGFAGDALDYPVFEGADYLGAAGDAGGVAGAAFNTSGVPIVGPLLRLAQGDAGGAAGSAIGGAIGSALGPIGTAAGSFLGGLVGGGCFITEAVMAAGGQGDATPELQILRWFRDNVMMTNPVGQTMVQQYEDLAPMVVEAVSQRPDALQIFQSIKSQFLDQAIAAIQQGNNEQALQVYAKMIAFVTPFAIEAVMGPGGEPADRPVPGQEGMDSLGTQAAMVAHSPEMANAAVGRPQDGPMMQGMGQQGMMQQGGGTGQPGMMAGMGMGGPSGMPQADRIPPPGAGMGPMPQQNPAIGGFRRRY